MASLAILLVQNLKSAVHQTKSGDILGAQVSFQFLLIVNDHNPNSKFAIKLVVH